MPVVPNLRLRQKFGVENARRTFGEVWQQI